MPLPWKKSKSGRISRFVSDLQQSPKHGGSLVVETGFPTSLIDLFVKNRDRLKKSSSKRSSNNNNAQTQTIPNHSQPIRRHLSSPPPPSLPLQRRRSLPQKLDPASVREDLAAGKMEESFVGAENRDHGDNEEGGGNGGNPGGGGCVLMVVVIKVLVVAVLALSTKKLAVGISLSAFSLLFLELAVARVFRLLNLCPDAQVRLDSLIGKLMGRKRKGKLEESSSTQERENNVSFEIIKSFQESRDCIEEIRVPESEKKSNREDTSTLDKAKPVAEEREVQTIRDVVFTKEKSKSAKLKSKIVKKIVPKKLRSYKKKRKMKMKEKEEAEGAEVVEEEGEEELSVTEVSSLFSEDRVESEISERDEIGSNPPLLESCDEMEGGEGESGSKGDLTKAIVLIVIALAGLLSGKVLAICLTLTSCLILKFVCCKSQTSL